MIEILVSKKKKGEEIALIENGNLTEYYNNEDEMARKEGNIYKGVVTDLVKGMQSAFINIGTDKNSFIHLKDALPKVNEKKDKLDTNINISQVLKPNQKILVQVKKDSNIQKGARVSTHINLPGKYIVLMPNTNIITISQKIEDKQEQERLIKIVKENISEGNGAVIRTSAIGKKEEIINDIKNIENKWLKIKKSFEEDTTKEPKLIAKAENIVEKMILDLPDNSINKIIIDNKNQYEKVIKKKENDINFKNIKIDLVENKDIFELYETRRQIEKLKNRKIWLKCGGFITIDKTEALTAIDVNTGKYTGTKNVEQTIYKVNEEATIEIARQLRLRDIGGIIIIDYIDMPDKNNKAKIQKILEEKLKLDRTKTQVEGFTKLDLMEMTRKHICSHKE